MNTEIFKYPLIKEISELLRKTCRPFWLAGGYSIDLFLGEKTRDHEDLDFVIKREDQLVFQEVLKGWDLQAANPPGSGTLTPWPKDQFLELPIHNIWCRRHDGSPWDLELLFSEFEGNEWVYRRNRFIRGPLEEYGWTSDDGISVLAPEIQLLYKSRNLRPKDIQDFTRCVPKMTLKQKWKLRDWIALDSGPSHAWIHSLSSN